MAKADLYGNHERIPSLGDRFENLSCDERLQDLVLLVRQQLDDVSKQQRQLANSREKLLMQREHLRSYGKILRAQREKTGTAEETFMNEVRRYWNGQWGQTSPPPSIQVSYQLVQQERDKLGVAEDDWIQAERKFGGAEWDFIDKEKAFYQHDITAQFSDSFFESLLDRLKSPSQQAIHTPEAALTLAGPDYREEFESALSRLRELKKKFNSMRKPQANYIEERRSHKLRQLPLSLLPKQDPAFMERYEDLLDEIADYEVKVQQLKQKMMQTDNLAHVMRRRTSEPLTPGQREYSLSSLRRAQTDGGLSYLLDNYSDTKGRIRDWLLDYLKTNAVEKRQYREVLRFFGAPDLEEDLWQERWDKDLSENYQLDDFPRQSLSQPASDRVDSTDQIDNDDLPTLQKKTKFQMDFEENFNYAPVPDPSVYLAPISPPPLYSAPIGLAPINLCQVSPGTVPSVPIAPAPASLIPLYHGYEMEPYLDSDSESEPPPEMIPYYDPDPDPVDRLTVLDSLRLDSHHGSEASVTECTPSTRDQPAGGHHEGQSVPHEAESDPHQTKSDPPRAESDPHRDEASSSNEPDLLPMEVPQASGTPTINIIDVSEDANDRKPSLEQYLPEDVATAHNNGTSFNEVKSPVSSEEDCCPIREVDITTTGEPLCETHTIETTEPARNAGGESSFPSDSNCLDPFSSPWKLPSPRSSSPLRARPRLQRPRSDGCRTPSKKRSISADLSAFGSRRKSFAEYLPMVQS